MSGDTTLFNSSVHPLDDNNSANDFVENGSLFLEYLSVY